MLSGIRNPNSAKLGTVCMMLAKPSTGLLRAGLRVKSMPRGTPMRMAIPVETATRNKCSKVSVKSSLELREKKSIKLTPVSHHSACHKNIRQRHALRDVGTGAELGEHPIGSVAHLSAGRSGCRARMLRRYRG